MTNDELFERARRVIPGGVNSPVRAFRAVGGTPRFIVRGDGTLYIFDADGKRYIDYVGSWGPMILDRHPAVQAAVHAAVDEGLSFGAPTELEIELVEAILAQVPSMEQVRLVSSGTEAAMSALRLARGATGRNVIVKFEGAAITATPTPSSSRPARAWRPSAIRPAPEFPRRSSRHARLEYNNVAALDEAFATPRQDDRLRDDRADRRQHELRPRDRPLHATLARALHRHGALPRLRRGDDTTFGRASAARRASHAQAIPGVARPERVPAR